MATTKAVVTQHHLTDIAEAIRTKGGASLPLLPSQMATAIEAIPTGGGWQPDPSWPDIKKILYEDTGIEGHPELTAKLIILYDFRNVFEGTVNTVSTNPFYKDMNGNVYSAFARITIDKSVRFFYVIAYGVNEIAELPRINGAISDNTISYEKWIVGNGCKMRGSYTSMIYTKYQLEAVERVDEIVISGGSVNIGNAPSLQKCDPKITVAGNFASLLAMTPVPGKLKVNVNVDDSTTVSANGAFQNSLVEEVEWFGNIGAIRNASNMFNNCIRLKNSGISDCSKFTSMDYMYYFCHLMKHTPFEEMINDDCTSAALMFANCEALEETPKIIRLPKCTSIQRMFGACKSIMSMPEEITAPLAKIDNNFVAACRQIKRLPKILNVADGSLLYLIVCESIEKDSVAVFDSDGNVIGGLANTITPATTSSTIQFNATWKTNTFTSEEQLSVVAAFGSKNWNVIW